MKDFFGWLFLIIVVLLLIGQVFWYSVGISTNEEKVEVPAGNYVAQILRVDDMYEDPVEAHLDLRHISGPKVDVYVLDKNNFDVFENEGNWITSVGGEKVKLHGRVVLNDDFGPVHEDLKVIGFNGRLKTDWLPIGTQSTLYLVLSSQDGERDARVEAVLTVRDD